MQMPLHYLQYLWFDFLEQIDEFDVSWEKELSSGHAAVIELGMQKFKLSQRTTDHTHMSTIYINHIYILLLKRHHHRGFSVA